MKKKMALFLALVMVMTCVVPAFAQFNTMPKYPEKQMVVDLKNFDSKNFEGPNVIEDVNMRYMINIIYQRKGTDEELKELNVTKEMVENLIVLSPEQCKAHNFDEINFKIFSLEGLQYGKNLQWISLVNQQVKSLDPIATCYNLKYLDIRNNTTLKNIDALKDLTNLETLDMHAIKVGNLNALSKLEKLQSLVAYACGLTNIDGLANLSDMRYLDLGYNDIDNIDSLSKMSKLEYLDLSRAGKIDYLTGKKKPTIKSIEPLKNSTELRFLSIQSHDITNIEPLKGMTKLNKLYISNNKVKDWSPIENLSIKEIYSAGNPVLHTGEVNNDYNDIDNPGNGNEAVYNIKSVDKLKEINVQKDANRQEFLPEKIRVNLEKINTTPVDPVVVDKQYINDKEIRFKVIDSQGNIVSTPLKFTIKSDNIEATPPSIEYNDGFLKIKSTGEQRTNTLELSSNEYELVNKHSYYEKYDSGNKISWVEKNNTRINLKEKDKNGNYIISDGELLIVNVRKKQENPDSPDNPTVKNERVNDDEIRYKVVDTHGQLVSTNLNFKLSTSVEGGLLPGMEFKDGYLTLKTSGEQRQITIGLNSKEYELKGKYTYYEKYDGGNKIVWAEKNYTRIMMNNKDSNGDYILTNKDVLTIVVSKIDEVPDEPNPPINESDGFVSPEKIRFRVVDSKGQSIEENPGFKFEAACEECSNISFRFDKGFLEVDNSGSTGIVKILLDSKTYDLESSYAYSEDYDWKTGKSFRYIDKGYTRLQLSKLDNSGNYVIDESKKDVLTIILKDKEELSRESRLSSARISRSLPLDNDDTNDVVRELPVIWNEGKPAYNGDPGIYEFEGTISLPKDVANPNNLVAKIKVIVEESANPEDPLDSIIIAKENQETPIGYVTVEFLAGNNGQLKGDTKYFVKKDAKVKLNEIKTPEIIPFNGYQVAIDKWSPNLELDKMIDQDKVFVAQYEKSKDQINPTEPSDTTPVIPTNNLQLIAGRNRIMTAIEVSKKFYKKADTVIVATAESYPDSLASSILAKYYKAPLLLNFKNALTSDVRDEIVRLGAKKIIIVGGINSISNNVEKEISSIGVGVERVYGQNRYGTSVKISERINEALGDNKDYIVTSGENFPDALSASQLAVNKNLPIILVSKNNMEPETDKLLKDAKSVIIVGGVDSISKELEMRIPNVNNRLHGDTRYGTAIKVANFTFTKPSSVLLASGDVYSDALVIGPVSEKTRSPILLVDSNINDKNAIGYIKDRAINNITVVGGSRTVDSGKITKLLEQ